MSKPSSRILSRKLVFLYYYARLFNEYVVAHPEQVDEIKATEIVNHEELTELTGWLDIGDEELVVEQQQEIKPITIMDDTTMSDDIEFIAQHQLPQHTNSKYAKYDIDFVMQLCTAYGIYREIIATLVNPYTDKFNYDEMSLTRRAILLLGYAEYKVISTPASIIINECVELAKSYEDAATAKLINGIMHQLLEVTTEEKTKEETSSSKKEGVTNKEE